MKKTNIKLFIKENFKYDRKAQSFVWLTNPDNTLFGLNAKGNWIKTKFVNDDFKDNPDYIYGRFYKRWGYLNVKDIKYIKYRPCRYPENHVLRDDFLLISYNDPIEKTDDNGLDGYKYDINVYGPFILDVLVALRDKHNWDITPIKDQIWEKCLTLKNVQSFTHDNYFDEAVKSKEHFESWFTR